MSKQENWRLLDEGFTLINPAGILVRMYGSTQINTSKAKKQFYSMDYEGWEIFATPENKFDYIDYIGIEKFKY